MKVKKNLKNINCLQGMLLFLFILHNKNKSYFVQNIIKLYFKIYLWSDYYCVKIIQKILNYIILVILYHHSQQLYNEIPLLIKK
jgi:hypothetical protein